MQNTTKFNAKYMLKSRPKCDSIKIWQYLRHQLTSDSRWPFTTDSKTPYLEVEIRLIQTKNTFSLKKTKNMLCPLNYFNSKKKKKKLAKKA